MWLFSGIREERSHFSGFAPSVGPQNTPARNLLSGWLFIGVSGCDAKGKCHMTDPQVNVEHEKERGWTEWKHAVALHYLQILKNV